MPVLYRYLFVYMFVAVIPIFDKCRIIFSDMRSLLLNGCFWFEPTF